MDTCSYFLDNKALFGSYPTQDIVNSMENFGVRFFVDLTNKTEKKITQYKTQHTYINFPIKDNSVPESDNAFVKFIYNLMFHISRLKENEKMYIHCKGGHGRSGLVVACLCSCLFYKNAEESLKYTSFCHSNRKTMRDIWRQKGSPQTNEQKNYVKKLCRKIFITKDNPLSLYSDYKVLVDDIQFDSAIEAMDKITEKNNEDQEDILKKVILTRFSQNYFLKNILLDTGLGKLCFGEKKDKFSNMIENIFNKYRFELFNIK